MSSKSFSRQADSVCSDYDFLFKILILGNSGVGKSSLLLRYSDDTFTDVFIATIGVDFKIRTVEMEGKKLKLQMWDTAGQDRFRSVISSFYRKVDGVVVLYDVTDMNSFLGVETWLKDVDKFGRETACKILVGNKADLKSKKVVDFETGKALADKLGISFLETSAKQNTNVEQCFLSMAADLKATADKDALALPEREEPVRLGDGKTMFTSLPCWCK